MQENIANIEKKPLQTGLENVAAFTRNLLRVAGEAVGGISVSTKKMHNTLLLGTGIMALSMLTPTVVTAADLDPNASNLLYIPKVVGGAREEVDPNKTICYGEIAPFGSDFLYGEIVPLEVAAEGAWKGDTWADQEGCDDLENVQSEGNILIESMEVKCFNTNGRTASGEYIDPIPADCDVVDYWDEIYEKSGLAVTIPYTETRSGVAIEISNGQAKIDQSEIGIESLDNIDVEIRSDTTISWSYDINASAASQSSRSSDSVNEGFLYKSAYPQE